MSQHCGDAYHISYIRLFIAKIRANLAGGFVHGQSSEVVRTFFFEMPLYNTPSRKYCFPPLLLWLNDFHLSITVGLVSWNQSQQAACENNIAVRKSRKSRSDAPYTSSDIADLYGHIPGCPALTFPFFFFSLPFLFFFGGSASSLSPSEASLSRTTRACNQSQQAPLRENITVRREMAVGRGHMSSE